MEMPKPTPVHRELAALAGRWTGDETMHPSPWDPQGGVAKATISNHVACDGFWVTGDYEQRRGDVVTFRGHSVFGYDAPSGEVTLHWFDSMGMGTDVFRGKLEEKRMALTSQNAMGLHRMTYDLSEKGTLRSRMETSRDGKQWTPMFDGVYHRE